MGATAHQRHGRCGRRDVRLGENYGRDPPALQKIPDHRARRQRLLPGRHHDLLRRAAGRLLLPWLGKNPVLLKNLAPTPATARMRACLCGAPGLREFAKFEDRTLTSWSRARRVVGKAEVLAGDDNPRFIVTNLPAKGFKGDADRPRFTTVRLFQEFYCARGEMGNVLKQQVPELEADKMSTHYLASNQLRLWPGGVRVSVAGAGARSGLPRDGTGAGDGRQHPLETVESRGPGDGERAAGRYPIERRLSATGLVSALLRAADAAGADGRIGRVLFLIPKPARVARGIGRASARTVGKHLFGVGLAAGPRPRRKLRRRPA